ncbi:MAG: transposase [Bacteroidota bacterium]
MIYIFPQDIVQQHIVQHLSQPRRGPKCKVATWELVNAILYKLKTGCQWDMLPINSLITSNPIGYKAVFHHFRKWIKDGSWERAFTNFGKTSKHFFDLSTAQLDGTHSPAKRGGEAVGYQKRKSAKTTNILLLTDKNGLVVASEKPEAGNHHDLYKIEDQLTHIFNQMKQQQIPLDGLFVNADPGFDAEIVRKVCEKEEVILNVKPNKRNRANLDSDQFFDELMYEEHFSIERTNVWMDSLRTLLVRQDTTSSSWSSWHNIAAIYWKIKHRVLKL